MTIKELLEDFGTCSDIECKEWACIASNTGDLSAIPDIPSIPNIHQAVYAAASKPGALDMSDWHTCKTTHCRAGWVITLAGRRGRDLELAVGPQTAASLIYFKSDPFLKKIPSFFASEERAMAHMKQLAEEEAAR